MLKVFQNLRAKRKRRHTLSHPPTTTTSSTGRLLLLWLCNIAHYSMERVESCPFQFKTRSQAGGRLTWQFLFSFQNSLVLNLNWIKIEWKGTRCAKRIRTHEFALPRPKREREICAQQLKTYNGCHSIVYCVIIKFFFLAAGGCIYRKTYAQSKDVIRHREGNSRSIVQWELNIWLI